LYVRFSDEPGGRLHLLSTRPVVSDYLPGHRASPPLHHDASA